MIDDRHAQRQSLGHILRLPNGNRGEPILENVFKVRTNLAMQRPGFIEAVQHKQASAALSLSQRGGKLFTRAMVAMDWISGTRGTTTWPPRTRAAGRDVVEGGQIHQVRTDSACSCSSQAAVGVFGCSFQGQPPVLSDSLSGERWDRPSVSRPHCRSRLK